MILESLFKGFLTAFYIVLPIGALSVIYLKRSLQNGLKSGFASALGVAFSETLYATFAIYGVSKISEFLVNWQFELKVAGLILIVSIGIKTILTKNKGKLAVKAKKGSFMSDFLSISAIALFNPLTILGFTVIFSLFSVGEFAYSLSQKIAFLCGFFLASFSYSMTLISVAILIRNRLKSKVEGDVELINFLNFVSGIVLILFAILSFLISLL